MEELTTKTTTLTNKDLKDYTTKIKKCGDNIRKNYIKIAHLLTEVDNTECYLDDGFENTCDYAAQVLGIQKTTTYNMLKIGKDYISENGERTILTEKGADYSVSQIQALLPLGVDKVKEINEEGAISPDMSVRQIKHLVSQLQNENSTDTTDTDADTDADTDTDTIDGESGEELEELLKSFGSIDFLEDGTLVTHGELPEQFIEAIENYFKQSIEDGDFIEFEK